MKVLHAPYCFHPDPVGGTEVYVHGLARCQQRKGVDVVIAAPGPQDAAYRYDGLDVRRFGVSAAPALRELYGEGDPVAAGSFEGILESSSPDVVHLHAFTSAVSLRLVRAAKRRGMRVVFTYHTPTVSCLRGTLLRWGKTVCDGRLIRRRCSSCSIHGRGVNRPVSSVLGHIPAAAGRWAGSLGVSGAAWTAVRTTELTSLSHQAFRALLAEVDHIVAVCEWVKELLLRNGVAREKVTLSRQGLSERAEVPPIQDEDRPGDILRVAFMGRVSVIKGIQVLLEAVLRSPELPVRLDIFGVAQDRAGEQLLDRLMKRSAGDRRIRFLPAVSSVHVVSTLRSYDVVAVPSQWLESGPLVVYEAFAAGVPVLGSDLGGIAELVLHGRNGLLVPPDSIDAWAGALRELSGNGELLARLKSGVPAPRRMESVCAEMLELYQRLGTAS